MEQKAITVETVRTKLGNKGKSLTDQEVSDILSMLRCICNKVIDDVIEEKENYDN